MGRWRQCSGAQGDGGLMSRLLLMPLVFLLALGPFEHTATEYERVIEAYVSELSEGGCHNPGQNLDTPLQRDIHNRLTSIYSWPILTADAVSAVADFVRGGGVVDFGAGTGYFSYLLNQRGVDAIAVDNWSGGTPESTWHPVQWGDVEALAGTSGRALLLSWPPKHSPMALDALRAWNGTRLVYAGEILRRTADLKFHQELAANWHLVQRVSIPQWRNYSDAIYLFERRDEDGVGWEWMESEMTRGCTYGPDFIL